MSKVVDDEKFKWDDYYFLCKFKLSLITTKSWRRNPAGSNSRKIQLTEKQLSCVPLYNFLYKQTKKKFSNSCVNLKQLFSNPRTTSTNREKLENIFNLCNHLNFSSSAEENSQKFNFLVLCFFQQTYQTINPLYFTHKKKMQTAMKKAVKSGENRAENFILRCVPRNHSFFNSYNIFYLESH